MKNNFLPLSGLILILFFFSCSKTKEDTTTICFKGRYIGEGCWSVIQILEPKDERFKESNWQTSLTQYHNALGVSRIPDKYKNGVPFYFTISKIDSNLIYLTYCNIPKYTISMENFSDSACKISDN